MDLIREASSLEMISRVSNTDKEERVWLMRCVARACAGGPDMLRTWLGVLLMLLVFADSLLLGEMKNVEDVSVGRCCC